MGRPGEWGRPGDAAAAQNYDFVLSHALLFQLHDHIARTILRQDPHDTDHFGSVATGSFLRNLMAPGASRPGRDVLRETTGRGLDAQAMAACFQPRRLLPAVSASTAGTDTGARSRR